jgi:S-adenosylmethionine synthetase
MTDQPKPDQVASDRLVKRMVAAAAANKTEVVAGYAIVQANLVHCSVQALIHLLKHKGILTENDLSQALAREYDKRTDSLQQRSIIVESAPVVRPKDN